MKPGCRLQADQRELRDSSGVCCKYCASRTEKIMIKVIFRLNSLDLCLGSRGEINLLFKCYDFLMKGQLGNKKMSAFAR